MSDTERMLSLALIHAASDPGVTREALEEIQGLAKDPQRLRALLESEGLGGEEGEGDEEEEPDPEDVPIGKRYRGSLRPADLTIGKRYRPTVTKRLPTVGSQPDRKFSSTQFDLADAGYSRSQGSPMDQLLELALSVADEDLAEDGREEDFHVTAKYGLHTDNAADVIDAVAGFGSVPVTLGGITLFEGEEADVIKIEVLGDRLHELNALLADSLPHTDTHPTYQPHLTLAYVKPGLGSKYVGPSGLEGQQLDFWHLVFSNRQRERTLIDLTRNAATVTPVAVDPDEDTGPALARWYAGWFEALEASGLEVSESDLASAEDELDGTGWCVGRDDDGEWEARATRSLGKKSWRFAHLTKAAQRAPSGYNRASPFHFNGKDYVGGQFIPGKAIEEASPQDRAKLQAAKEAESKKAEASKAARGATAVDPVALAHTLSQHAGAVELTKAERGNAARAYAALQRHHGDLTLHRIGELAARAEQAWRSVTDDDPNSEGLRSYWTRQLAAMAGWVERAKGEGLTGEARGKPADAVAEEAREGAVADVVTEVGPEPEPEPEVAVPAGPLTIAGHIEQVKALRSGQLNAQQIRDAFERVVASEQEIRAELNQRKIKELAPRGAGGMTKGQLVDAVYDQMLGRYQIADSLAWNPFSETRIEAQRRQLSTLTDDDLAAMKEKAKAAAEARDKALSNPETLEEFSRFVASKGESALTPEQQARWDDLIAERRRTMRHEAEERQAVVSQVTGPEGLDMSIQEGFHAKKQQPVYVAVLNQRVERDKYKELEAAAKRLGGYYSAFRGNGAIPGFQFPTRDAAEKFKAALSGNVDLSQDVQARREAQQLAAADRLAGRAEDIGADAADSLGRDRLANTAKRAGQAASAEAEARKQQAFASTLQNISEAIGSGQGKHLTGVRNAAQVRELERITQRAHYDDVRERMKDARWDDVENALAGQPAATAASKAKYPWPYAHKDTLRDAARKMQTMPGHKQVAARLLKQLATLGENDWGVTFDSPDKIAEFESVISALKKSGERYTARNLEESLASYKRIRSMGIETLPELRAALRQYGSMRSAAQKADPVKAKERALVGKPIPGFFPTPRPVIDRMLEAADIRPGMSVLEPSAGKGDIADAVREHAPDTQITTVEPVGDLREILEAKGHTIGGSDFLGHSGQYDRIVMNPPFENGADADHVRHAYDQLKPGGKLVAVMSEGPFFRQDRKASEFRSWLEATGGQSEKMAGAFAGPDAFRQTGVNTRMVTIQKPEAL